MYCLPEEGGGGTPCNGLPRKGYLFQASGMSKGRDFTSKGI